AGARNTGGGGLNGGLGGSRGPLVELRQLPLGAGSGRVGGAPAIPETGQLPLRRRPSLQAVNPTDSLDVTGTRTVDLTAEDDTQTIPRLDSLERKLKDLEQQFG
ncbi:hypothetical protein ACFWBA_33735, partial [Streptomyces sp. NPDC059949]